MLLYNNAMVSSNTGYIYGLTDTLSRLAFSSRTVFGKKLFWYADVLAYIVQGPPLAAALVVGMFVGLVSIKSSYALINELGFSSFVKSLQKGVPCFLTSSSQSF